MHPFWGNTCTVSDNELNIEAKLGFINRFINHREKYNLTSVWVKKHWHRLEAKY